MPILHISLNSITFYASYKWVPNLVIHCSLKLNFAKPELILDTLEYLDVHDVKYRKR